MDTLVYLYLAQENENLDAKEVTLNSAELFKWITTGCLGMSCTLGILSVAAPASACYRPCRPRPYPVQHHFRHHYSYNSSDYSYENGTYSEDAGNFESDEDSAEESDSEISSSEVSTYAGPQSSAGTAPTAQGLAAIGGSAAQGSRFGASSLASGSRSRGQFFSPQGSRGANRQMSMRGTQGSSSRTPEQLSIPDSQSTSSVSTSSALPESFTESSDLSSYASDYLYHGNDGVASIGYYGEIVTAAQQRLKDLGFYQGAVDSQFGVLTYDAVIAYQTDAGLHVDGIVGPETRASLGI